jgi:hypothetical protein
VTDDGYRKVMAGFARQGAAERALAIALPPQLGAQETPRLILDRATAVGVGPSKGILVFTSERLLFLPGVRDLATTPTACLSLPLDGLQLREAKWRGDLMIVDSSGAEVVRVAKPAEDGGKRRDDIVRVLLRADLLSLYGCVFLGGHGVTLEQGRAHHFAFRDSALVIADADSVETRYETSYERLRELELGGPGAVTSGGGFIGGGFGAEGAVEGMAVAAVLNAVTTRTQIRTVIRLSSDDDEMFFHYEGATPETLRVQLSAVLARIGTRPSQDSGSALDPVERLERLAALHSAGHLSDDEFRDAKARLLETL